ncbi:MAG: hypothetical protein ABIT61_07515 [Steroidobacteraceae bacterium]
MADAQQNNLELHDDLTHHTYAHGWIDSYLYAHGVDGEPTDRQLCDAVHALEHFLHSHHQH